jgi:V8-like Glu-specific endopeptidase
MKKELKEITPFFCLLLLFAFTSCGKKAAPEKADTGKQTNQSVVAKSIIRDNNLKPVSLDTEKDYLNSIGRMELGCTVTHIGNNLAITAGHCVAPQSWYGGAQMFNFVKNVRGCNGLSRQPNSKYEISWGVREGSQGFLKSTCLEIVAAENNRERDFAIIRLDKAPTQKMALLMNPPPAQQFRRITIYSHPQKRALEWSGECLLHTKEEGRIQYDCDTEGGSSGAAVLDADTLQIVAIHNAGTWDKWNGYNKGTTMEDIIRKLRLEFKF